MPLAPPPPRPPRAPTPCPPSPTAAPRFPGRMRAPSPPSRPLCHTDKAVCGHRVQAFSRARSHDEKHRANFANVTKAPPTAGQRCLNHHTHSLHTLTHTITLIHPLPSARTAAPKLSARCHALSPLPSPPAPHGRDCKTVYGFVINAIVLLRGHSHLRRAEAAWSTHNSRARRGAPGAGGARAAGQG